MTPHNHVSSRCVSTSVGSLLVSKGLVLAGIRFGSGVVVC
jgi:hypothetical protein